MVFRIAHVITNLNLGGAQEWTLTCAQLADRARFEAHVVTGSPPGPGRTDFDPALPREHVRLHLVPSLVRRLAPHRDLRALGELATLFRRERFDLVHTHLSKAGILGRLAARRAGVRAVVHTQHGWNFYYSPNPLVRAGVVLAERLAGPWADRICLVCEHDRRLAVEVFRLDPARLADGRRGVRIPALAGPEARLDARRRARAALGLDAGAAVFGTIIRLVRPKRGADLVRAAAILCRRLPAARGVIVGSGPEEIRLRGLARELGLAERILFLPARTDLDPIFAALDVFVHPGEYEGLPGIVLKAMARGLAVVAVAAAGTGEVVRTGSTGVLVPVGDSAAMAEGIAALLAAPEMARALGAAGRRLVAAEHDEEGRVRRFEAIYLELLEGSAAGPARAARR